MEFLVGAALVVMLVAVTLAFIAGIVVVSSLLRGWVLSILWRWFMVPTLGLPALSVPQAIGIALVVGMLTYQQSQYHPEDKDEKTSKKVVCVIEPFLTPFVILLIGWVVRQYM